MQFAVLVDVVVRRRFPVTLVPLRGCNRGRGSVLRMCLAGQT